MQAKPKQKQHLWPIDWQIRAQINYLQGGREMAKENAFVIER